MKFWRLKQGNNKGTEAEDLAVDYLRSQGLQVLWRNYACRVGEIDLVMLDHQQTVVFVEVRMRSPSRFGTPAESITYAKQKKIKKSASHFLALHKAYNNRVCRFDALLVSAEHTCNNRTGRRPAMQVEWIQNAF